MTVERTTRLLADASRGDADAARQLPPIVYDELRQLAADFLRRERPGHTLHMAFFAFSLAAISSATEGRDVPDGAHASRGRPVTAARAPCSHTAPSRLCRRSMTSSTGRRGAPMLRLSSREA